MKRTIRYGITLILLIMSTWNLFASVKDSLTLRITLGTSMQYTRHQKAKLQTNNPGVEFGLSILKSHKKYTTVFSFTYSYWQIGSFTTTISNPSLQETTNLQNTLFFNYITTGISVNKKIKKDWHFGGNMVFLTTLKTHYSQQAQTQAPSIYATFIDSYQLTATEQTSFASPIHLAIGTNIGKTINDHFTITYRITTNVTPIVNDNGVYFTYKRYFSNSLLLTINI